MIIDKTTFLVFETEADAFLAESQISSNMGLELPEHWALLRPRTDGKWGFAKPDIQYMSGVSGYVLEEYDPVIYYIEEIQDVD
jgi:hypothetical protein